MSLIAICYRGFRARNLKEISFSESLEYMLVTADSGTIHMFNIKHAIGEVRPLNVVRSNEIRSFMKLRLEDLLLKVNACSATTAKWAKVNLTSKDLGNITVPGVKFIEENTDFEGRSCFIV